jgi:hypothetical protein
MILDRTQGLARDRQALYHSSHTTSSDSQILWHGNKWDKQYKEGFFIGSLAPEQKEVNTDQRGDQDAYPDKGNSRLLLIFWGGLKFSNFLFAMGTVWKDVFLLAHKHSSLEVLQANGWSLNPRTTEFLLQPASSCILAS